MDQIVQSNQHLTNFIFIFSKIKKTTTAMSTMDNFQVHIDTVKEYNLTIPLIYLLPHRQNTTGNGKLICMMVKVVLNC